MGFASFLFGVVVGGAVVFVWRDDMVEMWELIRGDRK